MLRASRLLCVRVPRGLPTAPELMLLSFGATADKLPSVAKVSFNDVCISLKGCAAALPNLAISLYSPVLVRLQPRKRGSGLSGLTMIQIQGFYSNCHQLQHCECGICSCIAGPQAWLGGALWSLRRQACLGIPLCLLLSSSALGNRYTSLSGRNVSL